MSHPSVLHSAAVCTIIIARDLIEDLPLVVAANRDELYGRASTPPQRLEGRILGGRDLLGGGTWLGATPEGFFAGLTNQPTLQLRADAPSRGQVMLEVLRRAEPEAAQAYLEGLAGSGLNPFNLVFGTARDLRVAYFRVDLEVIEVPPGLHVLPNDLLDSPRFPKVARAHALLEALPPDWPGLRRRLLHTLGDAQRPPIEALPGPFSFDPETMRRLHALCVRTERYGTVSASLLGFGAEGLRHYDFVPGRPGEVPSVGYEHLVAS